MDPEPRDWVAKARKGDSASFDLLVHQYAEPLVRFLTPVLGGDVHAAHDVAQDAFLVTWRTLPRLDEPRFFRAWLFRVAYHRAVTWLRRRGPQGAPFREFASDTEGVRSTPTRVWGAERSHDPSSDKAPRLHAALSSLPMRYASVITLHYFRGLGTRETAAALGVSHSTVKMRLQRGRTLLKNRIDPIADPPPPDAAAPAGVSP